jgi:peroxiredoxin Q/BCP
MEIDELKIGVSAPEFCLQDSQEKDVCLANYRGKWVVLYFYPKDGTKGCTLEALAFSANKTEFEDIGTTILGVSPDSSKSHVKFIEKNDLGITLLSDSEHKVLELYDVWQIKKVYGREYYGVIRSTFLLNPEGKISHVWRKVRVKGHVEAVKEKLVELQS